MNFDGVRVRAWFDFFAGGYVTYAHSSECVAGRAGMGWVGCGLLAQILNGERGGWLAPSMAGSRPVILPDDPSGSGDMAFARERVVPADPWEALEVRVVAVEDGLFLAGERGDLGIRGEISRSAAGPEQAEHLRDMMG